MKEQQLSISFSATGKQFRQDVDFHKAILFLKSIHSITEESFKTALNKQYNKNKDLYGSEPEIRINKLGISSVEGTIYTIVPAMLGLIAPHINAMTWNYLKNSFELIKAMTTCFFNNNTKIPTIEVNEKLEGSQVILAEKDSTIMIKNYNIVINAKNILTPIGELASLVDDEIVNKIQLAQTNNPLADPITIQKETRKYYDARKLYREGSYSDNIYCKIYRLNVKERRGLLTIFESLDTMNPIGSYNFIVTDSSLNDYIEALKYSYSRAAGTIKFQETVFGDKKIESVTLHAINNIGQKEFF